VGSTLRNDTHRAVFLADLAKLWDERPDLEFGELMGLALTHEERIGVARMPHAAILAAVKRAVEHTSTAPPSSEGQ